MVKHCIPRRMTALLLCVLLLSGYASASEDELGTGVKVYVNNVPVEWTDAEPFINQDGRTMVPLRAVAEALDLNVRWDGASSTAIFSRTDYFLGNPANMIIRFTIGSKAAPYESYYYENGTGINPYSGTVDMDTAPVIVNDRTYAPVRYLAEFFNVHVAWDEETGTAYLGTYSISGSGNFKGYYTGGDLDPFNSMDIEEEGSGYKIEVSFYRLYSFDCTATAVGNTLYFKDDDPYSWQLQGTIEKFGQNKIRLTITSSSGAYISPGDIWEFEY